MGAPAIGLTSFLQAGKETTYKTGVAATRRLGIIEDDPEPEIGVIRSRVINNTVSRPALYKAGQFWRYRATVQLDYEGLLWAFDALQGTATFGNYGGATTGSSPWVHTFTEKTLLNSYTLEVITGNTPTGKCTRLLGSKLISLEISVTAGTSDDAICIAVMEWVAADATPNFTITPGLTAVTQLPVIFGDASTWDDGSDDAAADVVLESFNLSIRNAVKTTRFGLGDYNIKEPVRNGYQVATLSGVKELQQITLITKLQAFTASSPKLVFGSAASKRITFDMGTAYITKRQAPSRGPDVVMESFTWEAVKDVTNASGILIKVENTESAIG